MLILLLLLSPLQLLTTIATLSTFTVTTLAWCLEKPSLRRMSQPHTSSLPPCLAVHLLWLTLTSDLPVEDGVC